MDGPLAFANDGHGDGHGGGRGDGHGGYAGDGRLFIGIDAGKVTTSLVWGRLGAGGAPLVEGRSDERHRGEPLAAFFALYRTLGADRVAEEPRAPGPGRLSACIRPC